MKKAINQNIKDVSQLKIQLISYTLIIILLSTFNILYYLSKSPDNIVSAAQPNKNGVLIYYWENFLKYQPNYMDGWLRLAEIEYQEGNYIEASYAIEKALQINPNSEKLITLREKTGL